MLKSSVVPEELATVLLKKLSEEGVVSLMLAAVQQDLAVPIPGWGSRACSCCSFSVLRIRVCSGCASFCNCSAW